MNIAQLAILVYGVLTLLLTFHLAQVVGSFWGMALAVVAAGLTYVYQTGEVLWPSAYRAQAMAWGLVLMLTWAAWGLII